MGLHWLREQPSARRWSAQQEAALRTVALNIGAALQQASLNQELRASEEHNLLVARVTNDVIWECDLATKELI